MPCKKRKRNRSKVSPFFLLYKIDPTDSKYCVCPLRPEVMDPTIRKHANRVSAKVSNIVRHLEAYHPSVAADMKKVQKMPHGDINSTIDDVLRVWSVATARNIPNSMNRFLAQVSKGPDTVTKEVALLMWLVSSGIPIHTTSSQHFSTLFELCNVKIRSPSSLRQCTLPSVYRIISADVDAVLTNVESIAVAFDGWKSGGGKGEVIGVVGQFITENWELNRILLGLTSIGGNCSAEHLSSIVRGIVEDRVGRETLISVAITDNASAFVKAARYLNESWHCLCHTIQLVVHDVMSDPGSEWVELTCACRIIVNFIRGHRPLKLALCQHQTSAESLDLILDNDTRWNSSYMMLCRFYLLRKAVRKTLIAAPGLLTSNIAIPRMFSKERLVSVKALLPFLESFFVATKALEADGPTLSAVPSVVTILRTSLRKQGESNELDSELAGLFLVALETRLGFICSKVNLSLLAAAMHPRYGHLSQVSLEIRDAVWQKLEAELDNVPSPSLAAHLPRVDPKSLLPSLRIAMETAPCRETHPLTFWKDFAANGGGALAPLARMFLAIPASSSSVERVFSSANFLELGHEQQSLQTLEKVAIIRDYTLQPKYSFEALMKLVRDAEENGAKFHK